MDATPTTPCIACTPILQDAPASREEGDGGNPEAVGAVVRRCTRRGWGVVGQVSLR